MSVIIEPNAFSKTHTSVQVYLEGYSRISELEERWEDLGHEILNHRSIDNVGKDENTQTFFREIYRDFHAIRKEILLPAAEASLQLVTMAWHLTGNRLNTVRFFADVPFVDFEIPTYSPTGLHAEQVANLLASHRKAEMVLVTNSSPTVALAYEGSVQFIFTPADQKLAAPPDLMGSPFSQPYLYEEEPMVKLEELPQICREQLERSRIAFNAHYHIT